MVCTFFGHREQYKLDRALLRRTIEDLIAQGVTTFYVGHQGSFDRTVFGVLLELEKKFPHISISVVLAYLPTKKQQVSPYEGYSMYPEGIEVGLPRFAIDRRNTWMIDRADVCVCGIDRTSGNAYAFATQAKKKGLRVVNVGEAEI